MENFKKNNLELETIENEGEIVMNWIGRSDERDPSIALSPYFAKWILQVSKEKPIKLNFCELQFMNSSTVLPIIGLVKKLSTTLSEHITVVYAQDREWQKASFTALKSLFGFNKNITIQGILSSCNGA